MNADSLNIEINVDGSSSTIVDAVTTVINEALNEAGFTNTSILSPDTGEPLVASVSSRSLLDVCSIHHPGLFNTPISIVGIGIDDEDESTLNQYDEDGILITDDPIIVY